jgi:hypothetical protein
MEKWWPPKVEFVIDVAQDSVQLKNVGDTAEGNEVNEATEVV